MSEHVTQRNRILALLVSREWVDLPSILDLRIANYRARISELRDLGHDIQCETEQVNGVRHSKYRLIVPRPAPGPAQQLQLLQVSE